MKKHEISEAFILDAHKSACSDWKKRIEEEVPELFPKDKFEVGKWYKEYSGSLVFITKKPISGEIFGFGLNDNREWRDEYFYFPYNQYVLASEKEVKEALIKEAKKRGFLFGIKFKELPDIENGGAIDKSGKVGGCFAYENGNLYVTGYGRWCVFKNGIWAEIIKETEVTQSELIEFYKKEKGIDNITVV